MAAPRLPQRPLARFALAATAAIIVAVVVTTALGADRLMMAVTAVLMAPAAWIAGLRRWPAVLAAAVLAAGLYMALVILPLYALLGGDYNPIAARHMLELAATMAAWCALPVAAGWMLSLYRPRKGYPP